MAQNLAGQRFGRLLVLDQFRRSKVNTGREWLCLCDCGVQKWVQTSNLNSGATNSCGCIARKPSLIGQRFGRVVVIDGPQSSPSKQQRSLRWLCRCDCSVEKWMRADFLRSGLAKSCGCLSRETLDEWRPAALAIAHFVAQKTPQEKEATRADYLARTKLQRDAAGKLRYQANRATILAQSKRRAVEMADEIRIYQKQYRDEHRDELRQYHLDRYQADPIPAKARAAKHRAARLQQTPAWADFLAMTEFYRNCPTNHTVDHIIPITGLTVEGYRISGLHVVWNLQYLPGNENYEKNNRMRMHEQAMCEVLHQ